MNIDYHDDLERAEEENGTTAPEEPGGAGCGWRLLQFLIIAIVTMVLVLAALWWLTSSRSFQGWVTDRISERTGVEWTAAKTRFQWPCDLVCYDLIMRAYQSGASGEITIGKARFAWRLNGRFEVELDRVQIVMVRGSEKKWKPAFLSRFAAMENVAEVDGVIRELGEALYVKVRDSEIRWMNESDRRTLREVDGMDFMTQPLGADDQAMRFYRLTARIVFRADAARGEKIKREWIAIPEKPYVEIRYDGHWKDRPVKPDFWSRADERTPDPTVSTAGAVTPVPEVVRPAHPIASP